MFLFLVNGYICLCKDKYVLIDFLISSLKLKKQEFINSLEQSGFLAPSFNMRNIT